MLEFLIKVEPSGRWGHLFGPLTRGLRVAVRGPYGTFVTPPRLDAAPLLFIAGGTGIAPVRAMIADTLLTHKGRRIKLLYSARTSSDFAYRHELRRLVHDSGLDLHLHVTREAPPRWRGQRGRITLDHLTSLVDDPRTLCFVCGPASMVADVPRMLIELGVDRTRVKVEEW
jgi:ferredoxin-NADP reductase